jgi:hypothetical protein
MSGLYLLQSNERWIIGPSFSYCQEGCLWHTPAGIVINLVEYIKNSVVLRDAWDSAMQELGKPAQISGSAILIFNVWGFLLGIAAVWLYACDPAAVRCRTQYCNPRWTGHLGHCRASVCRRSAERCCSSLTLRLVSCFCFSLAASSSFVLRKFLSAVTASLACFFFNSESFQPSKSGKDVCSAKDRAMIVKTLISGTCPHTCPILLELALGPESNRR